MQNLTLFGHSNFGDGPQVRRRTQVSDWFYRDISTG